MEVLSALAYTPEVATKGCRRVASPLEFFQRALSQKGVMTALMRDDPNVSPSTTAHFLSR